MPPAPELARFIGDAFAQVLIDPNGVQFIFESGNRLVLEERFEVLGDDGQLWKYGDRLDGGPASAFPRLLYRPIQAVEREEQDVVFRLEGGGALTIHSVLGPYESGHFDVNGRVIVF